MTNIVTIGGVVIARDGPGGPLHFKGPMKVDADGAPKAYHPNGQGLDNLRNAGHPGNWWGVVTDTGKKTGAPVVQGSNDPAPGYYVSPTALEDHGASRTSPSRYVDSSRIPYISLPGHHASILRTALGDLAMVVNSRNGRRSAAILADSGPADKVGEGSIALANALGLDPSPRHGGVDSRSILYVVFPHSGHRKPLPAGVITAMATGLFEAWGGIKRLASLHPEAATQLK